MSFLPERLVLTLTMPCDFSYTMYMYIKTLRIRMKSKPVTSISNKCRGLKAIVVINARGVYSFIRSFTVVHIHTTVACVWKVKIEVV